MSGFEIAGIVLGSLPLLISGLEHYKEGLVPIKDMLQYEYVVKELVRALNVARCRLRNTCEKLLTGLVDDEELVILLNCASVRGEAWKRNDLDQKLKERLEQSYEGYMDTIAHLAGLIFAFAKKMGLDSKFSLIEPTWVEKIDSSRTRKILLGNDLKRKSAKLWKRVKLGLDHKEFQELIKEMAHENLQLELLTSGNLELEPIRQERSRGIEAKHLKGIREFATRLYSCLLSRWPCQCGVPHQASLRLDMRSTSHKLENGNIKVEVVFATNNGEIAEVGVVTPWKWRNTEIRGIETSQEEGILLPARAVIGRNVSFGPPLSPPISQTPSPSSPPPGSQSTEIKDLCFALAQEDANPCCLGYLDDENWQHYIYFSTQRQAAQHDWAALSLHQIATNLRSCLLQLYCSYTILLGSMTTGREMIFYLLKGWSEKPLAKNIYVSKTFPSPQTNIALETDPDLALLRNISVFNLGLALLELTFGHPIEYYESENDLRNGTRTVMTNWLIAERLIGEIEMYEGKRYSDVVYRCIHCEFGSRVNSFENEEFRQNFYSSVLVPLEKILNDFVK